jgi:hypothetical protein
VGYEGWGWGWGGGVMVVVVVMAWWTGKWWAGWSRVLL